MTIVWFFVEEVSFKHGHIVFADYPKFQWAYACLIARMKYLLNGINLYEVIVLMLSHSIVVVLPLWYLDDSLKYAILWCAVPYEQCNQTLEMKKKPPFAPF